VIADLSGDRVLTQELVEGRPWQEALSATQELRDQWGEAIFRFLFGAQYRFSLFHADPHPGNYLFHDDGSVSFLDYGCVKRMRREQVRMMYAILRACVRGDVSGTWQASVEAGFFRSTDRITPDEVYDYWREACEMYWAEQPFTFTPEAADRVIESKYSPSGSSAHAARHVSAPGENATLARLEVGLTSVLATGRRWRPSSSTTRRRSPRWASSTGHSSSSIGRWRAVPDRAAWPFPTEDPYSAYHAARGEGAVHWNRALDAHLGPVA
jgi:ABC1 family protein